jgi:hypothetical protein
VRHFRDDLAPVFGLHLSIRTRLTIHLALILAAAGMIVPDFRVMAIPLALGALTFVILSFPRRLPNHLVVAWFMLVAALWTGVVSANADDQRSVFALLALSAFFLAGFHKLNRTYLTPHTSAALALAIWYLIQRGFVWGLSITMKLRWVIVVSAVVAELVVPVLVLNSRTAAGGIVIAVVMVFVFGCLGHAHFAVIMMAGLSCLLPAAADFGSLPSFGVEAAAVVAAMALGNSRAYRMRYLMLANYSVLGACAGYVVLQLASFVRAGSPPVLAGTLPPEGWLLLILFLLNGFAPYLGLKLDATMAMFSNIRPDERSHLLVRRPLTSLVPRYYRRPEPADPARLTAEGQRVFDDLFGGVTEEVYSAYYVRESVRCLSTANQSPVAITAREAGTGRQAVFAAPDNGTVAWHERNALFPCRMPADEPYCA